MAAKAPTATQTRTGCGRRHTRGTDWATNVAAATSVNGSSPSRVAFNAAVNAAMRKAAAAIQTSERSIPPTGRAASPLAMLIVLDVTQGPTHLPPPRGGERPARPAESSTGRAPDARA